MAVHESGIHATVAGVAMGLSMNLKQSDRAMRVVHPISSGFAVPVFAFFSAGVLIDSASFQKLFSEPVFLGIFFGLTLGKPLGVVATAWLVSKFTRASLAKSLSWWDVTSLGLLAGIGFTVSLLINELAFGGSVMAEPGTLAVLMASTASAVFASVALQFRKRSHAAR
jgi:NhaA family Na+:H+ antiporter